MDTCIVSETQDLNLIKRICIDDAEMFNRLRSDVTPKDFNPLDYGIWLKCQRGDEVVSLCMIEQITPYVLGIHINTPKQHRGAGSLDIGFSYLQWVKNNSLGKFIKINTSIPIINRDVILYALRLGFKKEGIDRSSIVKNGIVMDKVNLGITFEEIQCHHYHP